MFVEALSQSTPVEKKPLISNVSPHVPPKENASFEAVYWQTVLKTHCIHQLFTQQFVENKSFGDLNESATSIGFYNAPPQVDVPIEGSQNSITSKAAFVPPLIQEGLPNITSSTQNSVNHDFVQTILPYAKQAAKIIGLDPLVLIAQVALETGWGKHVVPDNEGKSSNNFFNIKSRAGQELTGTQVQTTEYIDNQPVKQTAHFKTYADIDGSFRDYIALISKSSRYQQALDQIKNPLQYLHALQNAGYATDPQYAQKIYTIYCDLGGKE